ncbi:MAG: glycosyltransferase family 4 protein [Terriglobales bacterium]
MHVLMLLENCSYPRDRRVSGEAKALREAGYEVSVIAPATPRQPVRETVQGVEVYRYTPPRSGEGPVGYVWEYAYSMTVTFLLCVRVFMHRPFAVIHAANPPDTFSVIAAFFKLFGVGFVFDHHDLAPEMYYARFAGKGHKFMYKVLLLFEKLSCRLADHVIATNESYKLAESARGGIPPERITVVRNGPEPDRLRPVAPDVELRNKAACLLGYAGLMGFQDGVDYLLRAIEHLVYRLGRRDFHCIIVGDGDAMKSLIALAEQLQITAYVTFAGWVSNTEQYVRVLSSVDICVAPEPSNPYNDRCTMIKIAEYMALEKPIVAFDLPEHRYTAADAAAYVSCNDEAQFARAISQLMDDPGKRQRMGRIGRERVLSQFAWKYSVPRLLAAYQAAFATKALPVSSQSIWGGSRSE